LKQIGSGGHSTVKLAMERTTGRFVVCKFIRESSIWHWYTDPVTNTKSPLEIHLMKNFSNEPRLNGSIIKYIEHYEYPGRYIIVMEYLGEEWIDLYDYIEIFSPISERDTQFIFRQVMECLSCLHWLGYTHNDIKGKNNE